MPKFVIERSIPDAGQLSPAELQSLSQQLVRVLYKMGPGIQWLSSLVADDTIYCLYIADDEAQLREHGRAAGLPATRISRVRAKIDPTTAER